MDFSLNDEQHALKDAARKFAEKEIAPFAAQWYEKGEFPLQTVQKLGALGFMGIAIPQEYGGSGLSYTDLAIVLEEIARFDASIALTMESHNCLCCAHINHAGTDAQKKQYLTPLAQGQKIGAWGLTEPGSGSDASSMRTTARKDGDHWVLNGSKTFITQGTVADTYVILANTDRERKQKGVTAFILEKGMKGFSSPTKIHKIGLRSSDTAELFFEDVIIPDAQRLGEINFGFMDTLSVLDGGRIGLAALATGMSQGALEESIRYSKERVQFGKPISEFQAIQWKLSEMATKINASRLMTFHAAYLKDTGKRYGKEASMAKLFASELSVESANEAVQIFGGYGYTDEYLVGRLYRDSKLMTIGEGTSEVQKMVIARFLLRE